MRRRYAFAPEFEAFLQEEPVIDVADPAQSRAASGDLGAPSRSHPCVSFTASSIGGIAVRIYRAHDADVAAPCVLFVHGGGFVFGDETSDQVTCEEIAVAIRGVVVALRYRLAPEHPQPAALDDCESVLDGLLESAAELGIDAQRLALSGVSAGGCLAAGLVLRRRDSGRPFARGLALVMPVLDDRLDTPSMQDCSDTPIWDSGKARQSWAHYLGGSAADEYIAPARARRLDGFPPCYISAMQFDPLRDEALNFAARLAREDGPVELHLIPGTFHGAHLAATAIGLELIREHAEALSRFVASPA